MTVDEFNARLMETRMRCADRTTIAARRVLVDGITVSQAAREGLIQPSSVSRAVDRLRPPVRCPHCNQRV